MAKEVTDHGKWGMRDNSGLTTEEEVVMYHLAKAWSEFVQLPEREPEEREEFILAVHAAQRLLAMRVVAREYPTYWLGFRETRLGGQMRKIKSATDKIKASPEQLAELLGIIADGVINATVGKDVLYEMLTTGESAPSIIKRKGLLKITDEQLLRKRVFDILEEYPTLRAEYQKGSVCLLDFFTAQVMYATDNFADVHIVRRLLREELG